MKIIPYSDKYFESVRNVCFETASDRYKENRDALYLLYCDYYLEHEKESCFIAVNDNDEVVGYIISAPNYNKYKKIYKSEYLNKLKNISKSFYNEGKFEMISLGFFKEKYPAHMHIDILPLWQKMGVGKELINNLKKYLIDASVNGLFLSCGYKNKNAQGFYEHIGFKRLFKSRFIGISYGMLIRRGE